MWPVCGVLIYPPRTVSVNSWAVRSANSVTAILQLTPGWLLCSEIFRRLLWNTWNLQKYLDYKTPSTSFVKLTCETPPPWRGSSSHDQLWTSGTGLRHQSRRWEMRGREIWGAAVWPPSSSVRVLTTNYPGSVLIFHLVPHQPLSYLQSGMTTFFKEIKNHQTSFHSVRWSLQFGETL